MDNNLEKASHLFKSWHGRDRLRLFRADLLEDGSFDEAVIGCDGVFHVAASMEFGVPAVEDLGNSLLSLSVRVVGLCAVEAFDREAAFEYAEENGIDLISVITTTVGGPFLTPTVPSSIQVLVSPITGDPKMLPILDSVNSRMGSIALVHIEDLCNAHVFLMEHPKAEGRYICCTQSCVMSELVELLRKEFPCSTAQRLTSMEQDSIPAEISSKKIRDMGFEFKYGIQDIIHQTIRKCVDYGFLPPTSNE
ncbi:UNVERIFIED_CONTAM: putative anthocyanidin reductase [Sesamum radiatum]|uniref:Anthocyanidin reductase n=1 Tax=Sesamum radiatum TaxID=300843 RepID=A0AAW2JCL0_SESRA